MEYRFSIFERTYVSENIFKYFQALFRIFTHSVRGMCIRAYRYYLTAKLFESTEKSGRGKKITRFINSACVYLHSLALFNEQFHDLVGYLLIPLIRNGRR